MEIPCSPADLTSPWLTVALRKANVLSVGRVEAFEYAPIEGNKGFYGQIVRLKLTYDTPQTDGPATVIAKFSTSAGFDPELGKLELHALRQIAESVST